MVTKYFKLFATTLVAILALAACRNERTIDLYGEEGDPSSLDVIFNVRDFEEVTLRSHLRPEDEHRIEDIVIWVFDKQGKRIGNPIISHDAEEDLKFVASDTPGSQAGGSTNKGVPFGGTETKGQFGDKLKLKLKNLNDQVTIVALGNFTSENFALEESNGTAVTTDAQLMAIDDIEQLRALRLNVNRENRGTTSAERYESPLMYAFQKVTSDDVKKGTVSIQMVPFIAKITTQVKAGDGVTINSIHYHYQNIPTHASLFSAIAKENQGGADQIKPLNTPATQMLVSIKDDSFSSEGYLMPNYPLVKKEITSEDVAAAQTRKGEGKSGYTAFDLRQKRLKEAAAGGYVKNGAWEYAPDVATAFVMEADITVKKDDGTEQQATLAYTVVLGGFGGVKNWSNPSADDLKKINNYNIESATHYKYTITINGVENVIVEATSANKLDEPNPSVEGGTVIGNKPAFVLDSHYEQRTVLLSAADFDIFKSASNRELKDDAKLQFMVQSPFQPFTLVSYTLAEAQQVLLGGVPRDKQVDSDWIRIYVHKPPMTGGFNPDHLPEVIYSNTKDPSEGASTSTYWGKTLTVEQFFAWLLTNPDPLFDSNNAICITIFVDEYYYDWDPSKFKTKASRTESNKDKNLWKTFANAADRKFFLLSGGIHTSADQLSHYTKGTYLSIFQHSIKTIFTDSPEGVRVWGVESIDETPNLPFSYQRADGGSRWINRSVSNGWINTWNILGSSQVTVNPQYNIGGYAEWLRDAVASGRLTKYEMVAPNSATDELAYNHDPEEKIWEKRTVGRPTGAYLKENRGFNTVISTYSPFVRNRDINRDGKMQANELKWYIPAQLEAEMMVMFEQSLPGYARLKAPMGTGKVFTNRLVVFTSSAYLGTNTVYGSNPICVIPDIMSAVPYYEVLCDYVGGGTTFGLLPANMAKLRNTVRLIRDLGIIEKSSIEDPTGYSYNFDEKYYKPEGNKMFQFIPNLPSQEERANQNNQGGVFVGYNHLNASTARFAFVDGELPKHNERDSGMRLYYKGFRLSKEYAKGFSNYDPDTRNRKAINKADEPLFRRLLRIGKSPCLSYYEKSDASDQGTWRLPNLAELTIMGLGTPSSQDFYFKNRVTNSDKYFIVWASTVPSRSERADAVKLGFFMRVDTNIAWPMGFDAPIFGPQVANYEGYVRCVRDLSDAEWQAAKKSK